jgi:hypothetical protein
MLVLLAILASTADVGSGEVVRMYMPSVRPGQHSQCLGPQKAFPSDPQEVWRPACAPKHEAADAGLDAA